MLQMNRIERKKQHDFFMLSKTFYENGVHTVDQALKAKAQMRKNAWLQILFVGSLGGILALIFQQHGTTILLFMAIILLYIGVFTYRGRAYIQRYIDEILRHLDFKPDVDMAEQFNDIQKHQ